MRRLLVSATVLLSGWLLGCSEEPALPEPEIGGGEIVIGFAAAQRQVLEKEPIEYRLQILTSEPIELVTIGEIFSPPETLTTAVGLTSFVYTFQEEAREVGRREIGVTVRAGGEEDYAAAAVDVAARDRIPIRFSVVDMTDHRRKLSDGEVCFRDLGETAEVCQPMEASGSVNTALVEGCTVEVFYRGPGYSPTRQSVQRPEGLAFYDRPLFAGWNAPPRLTVAEPLVQEGDRLTLYAMPDDFPHAFFESVVAGGDPEAPVLAYPFPMVGTQRIVYSFARGVKEVEAGVESTIRRALGQFALLAEGLLLSWELEDGIDVGEEAEALFIVGDSTILSPGAVTFDRTAQAGFLAAGEPAFATSIVYTTAGVGHPSTSAFGLRGAQGMLLRTLFPHLSEAEFDHIAIDAGYTPLAAGLVAVAYAYFGYPGLFAR
jgi:hypothetical protein